VLRTQHRSGSIHAHTLSAAISGRSLTTVTTTRTAGYRSKPILGICRPLLQKRDLCEHVTGKGKDALALLFVTSYRWRARCWVYLVKYRRCISYVI